MSIVSNDDVDKVVNFLYNIHTVETYRSALSDFVGIELTATNVQKIVATWGELSRSTITIRMSALRRLVKYKVSIGECNSPTLLDTISVPAGRPPKKRRAFTLEELKAFVAAAETVEDRLVTILLFDTGLRAGSIPMIRYKDLSAESFKLVVKNDREIEVFTTQEMRDLSKKLQETLAAAGDSYVFTNGGKEPVSYNFVLNTFRRLAEKAGIVGVTPHSARHTFANRLDEAGLSLPKISALMGHANVTTTMNYIHPDRGSMREAIQSIAISRG